MATRALAQDILICDMCETSPVQVHCNSCAANLCNGCVVKHISADTEQDHHDVVLYKKKKTDPIFPTCKTHKKQICEMKCQQCDIPVCVKCIASDSHFKHKFLDVLELINSRKDMIKQKTTELETLTYPKYEKAVSELWIELQNLPETYERLMSEISNQGEEWHQEIDIIINQRKQEAEMMKSDDLISLKKNLEEMKNILSTLHKAIVANKELLKSNNVSQVLDSKYSSPEMWYHPRSIVMPPIFTSLPIQREQLHQMFGSLTAATMLCQPNSMKLVEDKLSTAVKQLQLLDTPKSLSSLGTECTEQFNIFCLSPDEVWVSGCDDKIKRFILPGYLQETVTTTTGNRPSGITGTRQGDLIYTDYHDRSINRVRHGKIEKIISLKEGWSPHKVCCTASDDLLVTMTKPCTPSRVVCYSGSTEKVVIQFDEQRKTKVASQWICYIDDLYITENSDKGMICVSYKIKHTVVLFNQAGNVLFKYKGNLSSKKYKSFSPYGVVIDSMGHILVADRENACIHILDQHGHFIRYIDNCHLGVPVDLSLDRNNILYASEQYTSKVKVIKYLV